MPDSLIADISFGAKFGMWTIDGEPSVGGRSMVACVCDCGARKFVEVRSLRNGKSTGCGCTRMAKMTQAAKISSTTHGMSKNCVEYNTWIGIRQRCNDPKRKDWPLYGGRGIRVCERWQNSFEAFYADMGKRPAGHSIDRINSDGNYSPDNCVWSSNKAQSFNRSNTIVVNVAGRDVSLREACALTGQKYTTIRARYKRGVPLSELFPQ